MAPAFTDEALEVFKAKATAARAGHGSKLKYIITGDPGQVDLPRRTISGLKEALLILKDVEGIGILYLDDKDIVRHRLVKKVIDAYKLSIGETIF
jgi:phosphate starvation-inducible PhoH-like protein